LSLIAGIAGVVAGKTLDRVLVRVGGITFAIAAPLPAISQMIVGQEVALHTYLQVREDDLALFGFTHTEERDLFVLLLGVSGIGARTGLALLSTLSPEAICQAIMTDDADRLARAPGVGKKTAQRLALELKSPVAKLMANLPDLVATSGGTPSPARGVAQQDAIDALTGLGYSAAEAQAALRAIPNAAEIPLDALIVQALRSLAR
jgi:holliday junction DNA helicase RuvA